jgi:hypothetical protein
MDDCLDACLLRKFRPGVWNVIAASGEDTFLHPGHRGIPRLSPCRQASRPSFTQYTSRF